ncbi:MAG TPA: hypothetical protein DCQ37_18325 [Desulfobacteraceae bacterium]|nr:hypothetical protein [Desulfobacteraceae bacterium]
MNNRMRWIMFWIFTVLFTLIVLSTIAFIFYGVGDVPPEFQKTIFYSFIIEIGGAVVALFYGLFGLKGSSQQSVQLDLSGKWLYNSKKSDEAVLKYEGDCTIRQNGRAVTIFGCRKKLLTDGSEEKAVEDKWVSEWGYIFGDDNYMLRFEFGFETNKGRIRGYCVIQDVSENEFSGWYYMLPTKDAAYQENFGDIKFRRCTEAPEKAPA